MAVVSFGYPGTIDPGVTWANAQLGMGSRYWVRDFGSVRVTPKVGGSREVDISSGWFGGWGVTDFNDSTATVQLPEVVAGTEWFLIVARRTWGVDASSSATTFEVISAGTSATIPARNTDPGDVDDQPLGLVSLTAGQTLPVVNGVSDIRAIGVGAEDFIIVSEMALSYLAEAGVRARLGRVVYQYGMNADGNGHAWVVEPGPAGKVPLPVTTGWGSVVTNGDTGWSSIPPLEHTVVRSGNMVELTFQARRASGAAVTADSVGNITDQTVARVVEAFRPTVAVPFTGIYLGGPSSGSATTHSCDLVLSPNGDIRLWSGAPNQSIWVSTDPARWHIWGHVTYLQHS